MKDIFMYDKIIKLNFDEISLRNTNKKDDF